MVQKYVMLFCCVISLSWGKVASLTIGGEAVRSISVSGKSTAILDPQYAEVSIEVFTESKLLPLCKKELDRVVDSLRTRLTQEGVTNEDIITSRVQQAERYEWVSSRRKKLGYYARQAIVVKVRDMEYLPVFYTTMSEFPAISIHHTQYKREDTFEKRNEEFKKALLAARKKAEHMATVLGAKLGKVQSIQEVKPEGYFGGSMYSNVVVEAREGTPQGKHGTVTVSAQVDVVFFLE